MEKLIKQLTAIISKQIGLLRIIRNVEKSKNEVLSSGKLMDFGTVNEHLTSLIQENERLEREREASLEIISKELNLPPIATFKELIEFITDEKLKNEMIKLNLELRETVADIKYLSKINQELIEVVIQVLDMTLSQETLSEKDIDYTNQAKNKKEKPLLINRII